MFNVYFSFVVFFRESSRLLSMPNVAFSKTKQDKTKKKQSSKKLSSFNATIVAVLRVLVFLLGFL